MSRRSPRHWDGRDAGKPTAIKITCRGESRTAHAVRLVGSLGMKGDDANPSDPRWTAAGPMLMGETGLCAADGALMACPLCSERRGRRREAARHRCAAGGAARRPARSDPAQVDRIIALRDADRDPALRSPRPSPQVKSTSTATGRLRAAVRPAAGGHCCARRLGRYSGGRPTGEQQRRGGRLGRTRPPAATGDHRQPARGPGPPDARFPSNSKSRRDWTCCAVKGGAFSTSAATCSAAALFCEVGRAGVIPDRLGGGSVREARAVRGT